MDRDNSVSDFGKSRGETEMSTTALQEAVGYADALMNAEFRGRRDREKSVRFRLSRSLGIPESYLFRLTYKAAEMRDVKGEAYRRLKLAYERLCQANEEAADRYREARLQLRTAHEVTQEHHSTRG